MLVRKLHAQECHNLIPRANNFSAPASPVGAQHRCAAAWQPVINWHPRDFASTPRPQSQPMTLRLSLKILVLSLTTVATSAVCRSETGYEAWLRYAPLDKV